MDEEESEDFMDMSMDVERNIMLFPTLNKIDNLSNNMPHKALAEEFEYEEAKFNEVLKKKYQGFSARSIPKPLLEKKGPPRVASLDVISISDATDSKASSPEKHRLLK